MVSHAEVLTAALGQVPDGDPKVAKAAWAFVMGLKGGRDAIKGGRRRRQGGGRQERQGKQDGKAARQHPGAGAQVY